jgi:hypothetical protein
MEFCQLKPERMERNPSYSLPGGYESEGVCRFMVFWYKVTMLRFPRRVQHISLDRYHPRTSDLTSRQTSVRQTQLCHFKMSEKIYVRSLFVVAFKMPSFECVNSVRFTFVNMNCWLRHYATSRKFAGSIPDEVIGILIDLILPAALRSWGSTQPLTEMSTSNLPGGKERPTRKAENLNAICELIV